jgi:hypothetical protein
MARTEIVGGHFIGGNFLTLLNAMTLELYNSQPPLATDAFAESTAITSYPQGISIMPVSAAADWREESVDGHVVTQRTGSWGIQSVYYDWQAPDYFIRSYDPVGGDWVDWESVTLSPHNHTNIVPLSTDAFAESAVGGCPSGLSVMPVSAGANWGPNSSEAGHVSTESTGSIAKQTFVVPSTSTSYIRYLTGGAWGSWISHDGMLSADALAESAAITSYASGPTAMPVSGGANWGPNTGEAGIVHTTRNGSDGIQTFHAYNNNQYRRAYTSSAWSSWVAT